MSDISVAIIASIILSILLVFIQVSYEIRPSSKGLHSIKCNFTLYFFLYLIIVAFGNVVTTFLASGIVDSILLKESISKVKFDKVPLWLMYSVLGVFGFEAIIKQINITFLDKELLTLNKWISKSKFTAVNIILVKITEEGFAVGQKLANKYYEKHKDDPQIIHTFASQVLDESAYEKIKEKGDGKEEIITEKLLVYTIANEQPQKLKAELENYNS